MASHRWHAWVMLLAGVAAAPAAYGQPGGDRAGAPAAEVVVVSTLHQYHEEIPGYSYADLEAVIERLRPDVLAVELTPADLANRVPQKIKREYQEAVYPLLAAHPWRAVAIEPDGEAAKSLIAAIRGAEASLARDFPQKAETADLFADTQFAYLRARWRSAADVNSFWTDAQYAVKHEFQEKLYGPGEVQGWEGWNQHFLNRIMEAVRANPGKRIVVTVGAEHGYWLRAHLRAARGVRLLDTATLLAGSV